MNVEVTESMHETVTSGGAWPLQVCAWLTVDAPECQSQETSYAGMGSSTC